MRRNARIFVSGTEFSRNMAQIVKGAKNVKTATFQSTARKALD